MNRLAISLAIAYLTIAQTSFADEDAYYCPQNHGYIKVGMSMDEVISACGQPISKQQLRRPLTQKVPMKQMFFNNQSSQKAFYGVWAVPTGTNDGGQLQIDIVENKVHAVHVNGSGSNAFSICGNRNIQVGDPATMVYSSCGSPSMVNNTFIYQPIQSNTKPEVWVYQPNEYEAMISLTFVNGKLQSIE